MNNKDILPLTEFDLATSGTYLQMLKAFIPFVGLKEQKMFSIAIRVIELVSTINFFKNLTEPSPLFRGNHDKDYILKEIKRFCPQKDLEILNMITNFSNVSDLMNTFQNVSDTSVESDLFKNFLSPDQQKLYESYQKILNS